MDAADAARVRGDAEQAVALIEAGSRVQFRARDLAARPGLARPGVATRVGYASLGDRVLATRAGGGAICGN